MRTTSLLSLATLLASLSNAAPAPLNLVDRNNALAHRSASPSPAILVPVEIPDKRSLPSNNLHKRMLKFKNKKGDKDKDDDKNGDPSKPPDDPKRAAVLAERKKKAEEKQAQKAAKAAEKERREQQLTADQRREQEQRTEEQKQQDRDRNEIQKNGIEFRYTDADIRNAWRAFQNDPSGKGGDKRGHVKADDIADAFKKCVGEGEFLFWSSGGDKLFEKAMEGAIKNAKGKDMKVIASAAGSAECKAQGLAGMGRTTLHSWVVKYIKDEIYEDHKRTTPKDRQKRGVKDPNTVQNQQIRDKIFYDYYWAVMSTGYAKAASGDVYHVSPKTAVVSANSHWEKYEKPNLDRSKVPSASMLRFDPGYQTFEETKVF